MSLFGLSSCCDEGFGGFDAVFKANSRLDVAAYILTELIQNGFNGQFRMFGSMDFKNIRMEHGNDRDEAIISYLKTITPTQFLSHIDNSYVDGDSYFQMDIYEIIPENAIDLTK